MSVEGWVTLKSTQALPRCCNFLKCSSFTQFKPRLNFETFEHLWVKCTIGLKNVLEFNPLQMILCSTTCKYFLLAPLLAFSIVAPAVPVPPSDRCCSLLASLPRRRCSANRHSNQHKPGDCRCAPHGAHPHCRGDGRLHLVAAQHVRGVHTGRWGSCARQQGCRLLRGQLGHVQANPMPACCHRQCFTLHLLLVPTQVGLPHQWR